MKSMNRKLKFERMVCDGKCKSETPATLCRYVSQREPPYLLRLYVLLKENEAMKRNYTNPDTFGYLLEAKACEKVIKDLRRISEKYQRAVDKEAAVRQSEFETAMQYTNEQQIQDDYGWDIISEAQYERYLPLFREGKAALEHHAPTKTELALRIVRRIISSIEADCREWEFSALSPEEQTAELERMEKSQREWKQRIAEIKKRRGIIEADATQTEEIK